MPVIAALSRQWCAVNFHASVAKENGHRRVLLAQKNDRVYCASNSHRKSVVASTLILVPILLCYVGRNALRLLRGEECTAPAYTVPAKVLDILCRERRRFMSAWSLPFLCVLGGRRKSAMSLCALGPCAWLLQDECVAPNCAWARSLRECMHVVCVLSARRGRLDSSFYVYCRRSTSRSRARWGSGWPPCAACSCWARAGTWSAPHTSR